MNDMLSDLLLEYGNEILLLVDSTSLAICSANPAAARHLGYPMESLLGRPIIDIECGLSDVFYWEEVRRGVVVELHDVEAAYLRQDGEVLQVQKTVVRTVRDSTLVVVRVQPLGTRQRAEDELADLGARLQATLEATADGILLVDRSGAILNLNRRFAQLWEIPESALLEHDDQAIFDFMAACVRDPAAYRARLVEIQPHGDGETSDILWLKNGRVFERTSRVAWYRNTNIGRVFSFTDITELKHHQHQLERMARYDALTEIPNRVLLADRLEQAIAQSQRRARSLAVVYLDLDGFKAVNDLYGHEVGDLLLIAVAQRLRDTLRVGDTLARIGGDEFVALLADLGGQNEWVGILRRMQQAAASSIRIRQHTLQVSASFGVTLFPQDPSDADTLLRHADQAMYQAKQAGKNRYHRFDPDSDRQTRMLFETRRNIARALEQDEFVLFYQPKVNMRTGAVVGAEALIRWQHPERGLLLPGDFLPLIEDDALIVQLGDWVLGSALKQLSEWQSLGLAIPVSVNIAAYHLQQHDFLERLKARLDAHAAVPHGMLELEVVETAALQGTAKISSLIEKCRSMGVSFSLDDFGTGYSSLTYLRRLPASTLKIDRSFVRDMHWDSEDMAIVEGVIGLAAAFGRDVIAEGVETACHGELLLRLGCNLAQGYGIAHPMPASAVPGWVANWRSEPSWRLDRNLAVTRDDLSLTHAEVDLRRWVNCIQSRVVSDQGMNDVGDRCEYRFGRWYDGEGRIRYGILESFAAIGPLHETLQALGNDLVASCEAGLVSQARSQLDELHTSFRRLVGKLHVLLDESVAAHRLLRAGDKSLSRTPTERHLHRQADGVLNECS